MAEGRRREDEEEELRERRELGGPRRARGRALPGHAAADRSERRKPEHRSSSQGALSSIRAVIKRSSRTCIQSDLPRDRRRPEITIVAAEPLRPASWFPGAPPRGLGFPATPVAGPWRPSDLVPAELPPSYEQVIKEIHQVQVNTTNNNNAAALPRSTITSATQTDFAEGIDCGLPPALPAPLTPLQPSPAAPGDLPASVAPLIVFEISEEQNCPDATTAARCPVPRPRSKSNLRPVARDAHSKERGARTSPAPPGEDWPPASLLDGPRGVDGPAVRSAMDAEQSQSSVVSRIKALEGQTSPEGPGPPRRPEAVPRTVPPRPAAPAGKPAVAPKPVAHGAAAAHGAAGEWDSWARPGLPACSPQDAAGAPVTKPELPKTSAPRSREPAGRKVPTPAPRPLPPRRRPDAPAAPARPPAASPARAPRAPGEAPPSPPAPALADVDLISFDDDVLPAPASPAEGPAAPDALLDPFQLPTKAEPAKERAVQAAAPTRKPTVIRIPAKPGKCLREDSPSPPPLPAEKPVGNTCSTVPGKRSHPDRARNPGLEQATESGLVQGPPRLPPRPEHGKVIPVWRPPKGAPERPPPPKLPAAKSSKNLPFSRSSSDMELQKKQGPLAPGLPKAKSQVLKNQDPVLPPRPKPGHPLYRKYMLSVPRGLASEDAASPSPAEQPCKDSGHTQKPADSGAPHALVLHDFPAEQADDLSLTSGETVYLLEKIDTEWYRGRCRGQSGLFPANHVRVLVDIPEGRSGKRESFSSHCAKGPRCVARFEFIGDQKDELSFSEGEVIILKEYVNEEWARGEIRDRTGIFPLNFVELAEDPPTPGADILSTKVPPKTKNEEPGSSSEDSSPSGEWCKALHSFAAETSEDLPLSRGDRILILERLDSDWCRGRLHGREGIFPAAFVQPCPAEARSVAAAALKGRKARALYDFLGENEDELSFKAGDVITELEPVDEAWVSGELKGRSGIFPRSYVQFLQVS